jgi:hypothetical protein
VEEHPGGWEQVDGVIRGFGIRGLKGFGQALRLILQQLVEEHPGGWEQVGASAPVTSLLAGKQTRGDVC